MTLTAAYNAAAPASGLTYPLRVGGAVDNASRRRGGVAVDNATGYVGGVAVDNQGRYRGGVST